MAAVANVMAELAVAVVVAAAAEIVAVAAAVLTLAVDADAAVVAENYSITVSQCVVSMKVYKHNSKVSSPVVGFDLVNSSVVHIYSNLPFYNKLEVYKRNSNLLNG